MNAANLDAAAVTCEVPLPLVDAEPVWDDRVSAWLVGRTRHHYIHIVPMLLNHRIVLTPIDDLLGYDVGWCYDTDRDGRGYEIALDAVRRWNPACEDAPPDFKKAIGWMIAPGHPRRDLR